MQKSKGMSDSDDKDNETKFNKVASIEVISTYNTLIKKQKGI